MNCLLIVKHVVAFCERGDGDDCDVDDVSFHESRYRYLFHLFSLNLRHKDLMH